MATASTLSWPFRVEGGEFPKTADLDRTIADSLTAILMTRKGELVMDPGFGINADSYLFENNNPALAAALKYEVSVAIATYEPRVVLRAVQIGQRDTELTLTIVYIIKSTRQDRSLALSIPKT